MITEASLQSHNSSAIAMAPTEEVSDAVVPDNVDRAQQYEEWLSDAAAVCGHEMKGDIDPVSKQAENLVPVANSLEAQLGLEDLSGAAALIAQEEEEELNRLDEESRQYNFTAEDLGICPTEGSYSPATEAAIANLENVRFNYDRINQRYEDGRELLLSVEAAGVIDRDTAEKIKERIPGALANVNMKMFTKTPSTVGMNLAREMLMSGAFIGAAVLTYVATYYVAFKLAGWLGSLIGEGVMALYRAYKRLTNFRSVAKRVNKETFDPDGVDTEKMVKALFKKPTPALERAMIECGRQPLTLRDIKWSKSGDNAALITPFLKEMIKDTSGASIILHNRQLTEMVDKAIDAGNEIYELLADLSFVKGKKLSKEATAMEVRKHMVFLEATAKSLKVNVKYTGDDLKVVEAIKEHLSGILTPTGEANLPVAPSIEFISILGETEFDKLDSADLKQWLKFTKLDTKYAKDSAEVKKDTPEEAKTRKDIANMLVKSLGGCMELVGSITQYAVYIEKVITEEDQFINKVKRFTS